MEMYTKVAEAFVYEPYYVVTFESDLGAKAKVTVLYHAGSQLFNLVSFE